MFDEGCKIFPAYRLYAGNPFRFQKFKEEPYGGVVEFKCVGASVPAIKVRKVLLHGLKARQLLSFEFERELFEYLFGGISSLPKWEKHLPRGGLKLTPFYLF